MYQLLLILRYLRRKLAPLFAAVAVMLCTAMVIIVISVMGGFLDNLRSTARSLTGDVVVSAGSYTGFPYYQDLIDRLQADDSIQLATPVIEGFCLLRLYGNTTPVQVHGIKADQFSRVVSYRDTLYWKKQDFLDYVHRLQQANPDSPVDLKRLERVYQKLDPVQAAMDFTVPPIWQPDQQREAPGAVLGIEISPRQTRDLHGKYDFANNTMRESIALTTVPITSAGGFADLKPTTRRFVVVNEFKSGYYEADQNRVFIGFDQMQAMLQMQRRETEKFDPERGGDVPGVQVTPARTSLVMAKAAPGYTPDQAEAAADRITRKLVAEHRDMPMLYVETWSQRHATLLSAVENEKGLVTFLFGIISVVAIVMVATTFYMIVLEKTRDIGTLRAIGASRSGILNLFLGYGLAIGIVGSLIGCGLAYAIVMHLNGIQDVIAQFTGWRMWDPRIYAFDRIPDQVKTSDAVTIVIGAILSSVVGALIPAVLAARLDPIQALRYE